VKGLTPALLSAVADEIAAEAGLRVKAVHQDGEHRFRVALERGGTRRDLLLDLDPEFPRAHLAAAAPAPRQPSPLAHALRNALVGAALSGARTVPGERALELTFSLGGLARTLWFEAFGRQANLYLLDERGLVLATPRGDVARARNASVGAPFVPVPPRAGEREVLAAFGAEGPSAWVERRAHDEREQRAAAGRRTALERSLRQATAKARGTVVSLEAMEGRGSEAPALRRRGELLRACFHEIPKGAERARVTDPASSPPTEVWVDLDPKRGLGEQIGALFHEAERCERAEIEARARLPSARARLAALEGAAARLTSEAALADLEALAAEVGLEPKAKGKPAAKGPQPAVPWRTFRSADGWTLRVGKDARGNDRLTLHEAAPHDLFVHVRGASGSHVLVTTPRGKSVPKETLLDAAELACVYSQRAKAEHNEVDYVERRHVRKPRGSPAGLVELDRSKTMRVRRDDSRRERLRTSSP
jgi:predicted ribosome quality control (RQC) complex YloA/Tae2 family protein